MEINNKEFLETPFIANNEQEEKKDIQLTVHDKEHEKDINYNINLTMPPKPTLEHEIGMWNTINAFEKEAWKKNRLGLKTGYPGIDKGFDGGIKPGYILLAADSNVGKSAFLSQLAWQIASLNDNAYVMDFSLDDPIEDKLSRIIASKNKILINAVKNPLRYKQYPLMLARRIQGINDLRNMVDRYRAYDAKYTTNIEDIEEEIIKVKIELDAKGIDKQICVFIDNFHDLTIKAHPSYQDKQKYDYLAQYCADLAINHNIILFCTAELRKQNALFRPSIDAIRESVKIKYEAKAILLAYNEVHYKGEGANVFYRINNNNLKQPVFEVHFAKNKFSNFKGRLFYEMYPDISFLEEASKEAAKGYSSLVYNN